MNTNGTTEISNLPLSPQTPTNNKIDLPDNIKLPDNVKIPNYIQTEETQSNNDPAVQQKAYNQLVSGLQQANVAGALNLPSRDIPQETLGISQDEQIKPNFIPNEQQNIDYISNHDTAQDIIRNNMNEQRNIDSLERLYEEFQIPILLSVMYFIYQLPAVRIYLHKIIPSLFNKDGNPNLYGYVFNSILFGLMYYLMLKVIKHFTEI